jgi:prophage antirepressor-like protein
MDLIKCFVLNNVSHEINILYDGDKPLFRASEVGKILELKNVRESIKNFDEDEKRLHLVYTPGGCQEVTVLTEMGLYRLLMRSDKPIARPFQKWVASVIATIRETGRYELEGELEKIKADLKTGADDTARALHDKYATITKGEVHRAYLAALDNKPIVYFVQLGEKTPDGHLLVKIGSTANLRQRVSSLVKHFGELKVVHAYQCARHLDFERFLQRHDMVRHFAFTEPINGTMSTEFFKMTDDQLKRAATVAARNLKDFVEDRIDHLTANVDTSMKKMNDIQADVSAIREDLNAITGMKRQLESSPPAAAPVEVQAEPPTKRGNCTFLGPKIQRYTTEGGWVMTYDNVMSAARDPNFRAMGISRNGVYDATHNNSVYKGYRWMNLDRELPDDTPQELPVAIELRKVRVGHVAAVNKQRTEILSVFSSGKEVQQHLGYADAANVSRLIRAQRLVAERFYVPWLDVDVAVRDAWLANNELPPIIKQRSNQKSVSKLDATTGDVLQTYHTSEEVLQAIAVSRPTLRNAINGDKVLKGFRWKFAAA